MFSRVALIIATVLLNGAITKATKNLQKQQMKNEDARSKLRAKFAATSNLSNVLHGVQYLQAASRHIRNDRELVTLRKTGALQAVSSFVGSAIPFLGTCLAFAVRPLVQDKPLTTEIAFTAIAPFRLLTSPLTILPAAISSLAKATVAVSRLVAFFTANELQSDAVIGEEVVTKLGEWSVSIRYASFTWSSQGSRITLEQIAISARKEELCCLVGRLGSRKASILHALLGEVYKVNGTVAPLGSIAYVAQ